MEFRNILLATDLSEHSAITLQIAAELFESDRLTVLTAVSDPFISMASHSRPYSRAVEEFRKQSMEEARSRLECLCGKHFPQGIRKQETLACSDSDARTICDFATKEKYDLLVIGSHGAGRLASLFLGTTAQRIIALSPCPVLAIPEKAVLDGKRQRHKLHKILATTDLSEVSLQTIEALAGVTSSDDEIVLLSVIALPNFVDWQREFLKHSTPLSDYVEQRIPESERKLNELASLFDKARRTTTKLVEAEGNTAELICRESNAQKADCIAMGSAGAGAIGNLFLGSTVQGVLKAAPCPVLIFPRKQPTTKG